MVVVVVVVGGVELIPAPVRVRPDEIGAVDGITRTPVSASAVVVKRAGSGCESPPPQPVSEPARIANAIAANDSTTRRAIGSPNQVTSNLRRIVPQITSAGMRLVRQPRDRDTRSRGKAHETCTGREFSFARPTVSGTDRDTRDGCPAAAETS
ncbi:hypothetical protein [Nocardia arizonensis]|uniref:hypothetical protein n=1 Tax=Nocardia arizonensis TaxID=1141647 RepID=UPI000A9D7A7F|nr:hypothetical protein [Nocardia arizonensis]